MTKPTRNTIPITVRFSKDGVEQMTSIYDDRPPCSRHDDDHDDHNSRVLIAWGAICAMVPGDLNGTIARLHDHKGTLVVATRFPLTQFAQNAIDHVWKQLLNEGIVEFHDVTSKDWDTYWGSKRFESNWTP